MTMSSCLERSFHSCTRSHTAGSGYSEASRRRRLAQLSLVHPRVPAGEIEHFFVKPGLLEEPVHQGKLRQLREDCENRLQEVALHQVAQAAHSLALVEHQHLVAGLGLLQRLVHQLQTHDTPGS
mmetsp:Transcript_27835/g.70350  ORF Transcript_27835/g.70350 Transcript_27835/m.70350 type:complete len:124 (+) Transcript_27835:419-790(+)